MGYLTNKIRKEMERQKPKPGGMTCGNGYKVEIQSCDLQALLARTEGLEAEEAERADMKEMLVQVSHWLRVLSLDLGYTQVDLLRAQIGELIGQPIAKVELNETGK